MPRRNGRRRTEGSEPARAGSAERHAGNAVLVAHERRSAKRHAGMVKASGATEVGAGVLLEVIGNVGKVPSGTGGEGEITGGRRIKFQLSAEPAADRFPRFGMVANNAKCGGNRDGQK